MGKHKGEIIMVVTEKLGREGLIDALSPVLNEVSKNENTINSIDNYLLSKHNIQPSLTQEVIVNRKKLDEMSNNELMVFANAIATEGKHTELRPDNYFDQIVSKKALKYTLKDDNLHYPLAYDNVLIGSAEDCMVIMSLKEIAQHYGSVWTYNPDIQRKPTQRKKKDGTVSVKQKVYKKNIREIEQMMIDGVYKPDTTMTVNVFSEPGDVEIDAETKMLVINNASEIAVIDGFHRIEAIQSALEKKPSLDGYLYVSFRFYDEKGAKFYLGQFNSGSAFDKTHTRLLKNYRPEDKITNEMITRSDLKNHVSKEKSPNIRLGELTTFTILADSIEGRFEMKTGKDRMQATEALIRFFDCLIGSYPKAFVTDIALTNQTSWINYHNVFPGYVVLASALFKKYGKSFPLEKVEEVVNSINFKKDEDTELSKIFDAARSSNSTQVKKKVENLFMEHADKVLNPIDTQIDTQIEAEI